MQIALLGRTKWLIETGKFLHERGHEIVMVVTSQAESFYGVDENAFKNLSKYVDAPFHSNLKLNSQDGLACLRESGAEIGVSVNWPSIIDEKTCSALPHGILNAHAGDLPRYRGNACPNWAILNGEKHVGLCIHKMVGGELDNGDIVARDYYSLTIDTKVTEVMEWMDVRVPELFDEAICALDKDPGFILERQSIDQNDALRCYPRCPEDSRIDWRNSAIDILRLINASTKPYSGAFCVFEGDKVTIWDACLVNDDENYLAIPGQVTKIGEDYIEVAAGEGKIRLLQVEHKECLIRPNELISSIRKRLT